MPQYTYFYTDLCISAVYKFTGCPNTILLAVRHYKTVLGQPFLLLFYLKNIKILSEIFNAGFKDLKILLPVYVHSHRPCAPLRVRHLTEHTAVRAGDTLDGTVGAVHVPFLIHRDIPRRITILGCNLTVCEQLIDLFLIRHKPSFTMGSRIRVHLAKFRLHKPRRLIGNHFRIDHLRDMTSDRIIGQCRRCLVLSGDPAVRNQAKLDKSLETVADTKHQSVALIQQPLHRFLHLRILECCSKELGRTIRFISRAETSREHDDLRLVNSLLKNAYRIKNIFCIQIPEYLDDSIRSRSLERPGAVILTVGSGEYRDKYCRLRDLMGTDMNVLRIVQSLLDLLLLALCPGIRREYLL